MAKELNWNGVDIGAKAANVTYDNRVSGLEAKNVQAALDELKSKGGGGGGGYAPFNGKRMGVIGDSFTESGVWLAKMQSVLGLQEVKNKAISGGRWSSPGDGSHGAFDRAKRLYTDYAQSNTSPDYILIVLGVNDYGNNAALGDIVTSTIDDVTNDSEPSLVSTIESVYNINTFTGGAQATLTYLAALFPNAIIKIGWTPAGQQYMYSSWDLAKLNGYINKLKDLALIYGVQYIDTLNCGIFTWLQSNKNRYWAGANDGHPNGIAHQRIGEYVARLLLSNL